MLHYPPLPTELGDTELGPILQWVLAVDALKGVDRKTHCLGGTRPENSAEHSWHIALMALTLSPRIAASGGNPINVIQMLIIHDLVEILVGDTFLYDKASNQDLVRDEAEAAAEVFGALPEPIGSEILTLWREFEFGKSVDARIARAIDRLHPLMMNFASKGKGIPQQSVETMVNANRAVEQGLPELWPAVVAMLREADSEGYSL